MELFQMIVRALRNSFPAAVAVTIGGTLLPRLLHPERYEFAPGLAAHLWQNFSVIFAVLFAIWMVIYLIQDWTSKKK